MSAMTQPTSPLDRPLAVTFFKDWRAQEKEEARVSLRGLLPRLAETSSDDKQHLPWLKLARFGDKRTDKNSLRHNANVIGISGIEGDYDHELTTVDEALETLRRAGLAAVVYTSPSHTEDSPRWRVLCPLSQDYDPDRRTALIARLNGVFLGALSDESHTLSQSYYYGSVRRSPSHRVEMVDGDYLDQRADLDDGAVGRPQSVPTVARTTAPRGAASSAFMEAVIKGALAKVSSAGDGQKHHTLRAQAKVLGGFQHAGQYTQAEAVQWLVNALPASAIDLKAAAKTAAWGFEWGQANPLDVPPLRNNVVRFPDGEPPQESSDPGWWESIERDFAEENQRAAEPAEVDIETAAELPDLREGTIIDPREWTAPAPLREWLVQDWIPIGGVTGLYADGGVGKSLLMQQLLTCTAMGLPWLGMDVRPGFAFGMFCEDDRDELQRRQEAVNRSLGIGMEHLELLRYSSRVGFDNLLMTFTDRNQGEVTKLFTSMVKFLGPNNPKLVVIDTIADTFGGDEIKRAHARQFVQGVGGNLARAFGCAVVMIGHVSMAGMNTGAGTSGSTAWNNTFRSRMYLTKPKDNDGKEEDDKRLLSRKKANYAATGADLQLVWDDGCFGLSKSAPSQPGLPWPDIDRTFDEIDRAWRDKAPWSVEPQTRKFGRYLPTWMQINFGIPEQQAGRLLGQWQAGGYLKTDVYDARAKRRGLRVVKRIIP